MHHIQLSGAGLERSRLDRRKLMVEKLRCCLVDCYSTILKNDYKNSSNSFSLIALHLSLLLWELRAHLLALVMLLHLLLFFFRFSFLAILSVIGKGWVVILCRAAPRRSDERYFLEIRVISLHQNFLIDRTAGSAAGVVQ